SEEDIEALYESDADQETIEKLVATYEAAQGMKEVFANVKEGFDIVDDTLGAVIEQLDEAADHVNQFNEEMGEGLDDFEVGEEFSELTSGINEMATQYQEFHDGLVAYTGGVSELADNYRSEEHTSELQSRFDLVCRLLLEKKKHSRYNIRVGRSREGR